MGNNPWDVMKFNGALGAVTNNAASFGLHGPTSFDSPDTLSGEWGGVQSPSGALFDGTVSPSDLGEKGGLDLFGLTGSANPLTGDNPQPKGMPDLSKFGKFRNTRSAKALENAAKIFGLGAPGAGQPGANKAPLPSQGRTIFTVPAVQPMPRPTEIPQGEGPAKITGTIGDGGKAKEMEKAKEDSKAGLEAKDYEADEAKQALEMAEKAADGDPEKFKKIITEVPDKKANPPLPATATTEQVKARKEAWAQEFNEWYAKNIAGVEEGRQEGFAKAAASRGVAPAPAPAPAPAVAGAAAPATDDFIKVEPTGEVEQVGDKVYYKYRISDETTGSRATAAKDAATEEGGARYVYSHDGKWFTKNAGGSLQQIQGIELKNTDFNDGKAYFTHAPVGVETDFGKLVGRLEDESRREADYLESREAFRTKLGEKIEVMLKEKIGSNQPINISYDANSNVLRVTCDPKQAQTVANAITTPANLNAILKELPPGYQVQFNDSKPVTLTAATAGVEFKTKLEREAENPINFGAAGVTNTTLPKTEDELYKKLEQAIDGKLGTTPNPSEIIFGNVALRRGTFTQEQWDRVVKKLEDHYGVKISAAQVKGVKVPEEAAAPASAAAPAAPAPAAPTPPTPIAQRREAVLEAIRKFRQNPPSDAAGYKTKRAELEKQVDGYNDLVSDTNAPDSYKIDFDAEVDDFEDARKAAKDKVKDFKETHAEYMDALKKPDIDQKKLKEIVKNYTEAAQEVEKALKAYADCVPPFTSAKLRTEFKELVHVFDAERDSINRTKFEKITTIGDELHRMMGGVREF